jgi:hypothetical protein
VVVVLMVVAVVVALMVLSAALAVEVVLMVLSAALAVEVAVLAVEELQHGLNTSPGQKVSPMELTYSLKCGGTGSLRSINNWATEGPHRDSGSLSAKYAM